MGTYTWTITPNDIDREIKVWQDRSSGKLKNGWDFLAFNYDSEQIINVLKYAKELNKSVLITSSYLFWKADIIYDNYTNNNNTNTNTNTKIDCGDNTKEDNEEKKKEPMAIIFLSMDQTIHYPIVCYNADNFSELVKKLYLEYPELKLKNVLFMHQASVINTSATVEENKIKNGDNILIEYY